MYTQINFKIPVLIVKNLSIFQDFVLKKVPFSSPNVEKLIKFQFSLSFQNFIMLSNTRI